MSFIYLTDPKYLDIQYFATNNLRKNLPSRTISDRLKAWKLSEDYYDGSRSCGYGGFKDDKRWLKLLPRILSKINSDFSSETKSILDIGCKKGFITSAATELGIPSIGIENHLYPLTKADHAIRHSLILSPYTNLPLIDNSFDLSIAFSSLYMQNLGDVIESLREMIRVSRFQYVTLAAYNEAWERESFLDWTLLGSAILHTSDWLTLFSDIGYQGYYFFTTPTVLGLDKESFHDQ